MFSRSGPSVKFWAECAPTGCAQSVAIFQWASREVIGNKGWAAIFLFHTNVGGSAEVNSGAALNSSLLMPMLEGTFIASRTV